MQQMSDLQQVIRSADVLDRHSVQFDCDAAHWPGAIGQRERLQRERQSIDDCFLTLISGPVPAMEQRAKGPQDCGL